MNKMGSLEKAAGSRAGSRRWPVRGGGGKADGGAEAGSIVWTALHTGETGLGRHGDFVPSDWVRARCSYKT